MRAPALAKGTASDPVILVAMPTKFRETSTTDVCSGFWTTSGDIDQSCRVFEHVNFQLVERSSRADLQSAFRDPLLDKMYMIRNFEVNSTHRLASFGRLEAIQADLGPDGQLWRHLPECVLVSARLLARPQPLHAQLQPQCTRAVRLCAPWGASSSASPPWGRRPRGGGGAAGAVPAPSTLLAVLGEADPTTRSWHSPSAIASPPQGRTASGAARCQPPSPCLGRPSSGRVPPTLLPLPT